MFFDNLITNILTDCLNDQSYIYSLQYNMDGVGCKSVESDWVNFLGEANKLE